MDSNVPRPLDSSELPAEGQSQTSVSTEREKVHQPSVTVKETDYDSRKVPLSQTAATFLHSAIPSQGDHIHLVSTPVRLLITLLLLVKIFGDN